MSWSVAIMVVAIVLITALAKVSKARYEALGRAGDVAARETPNADAVRHAEEVRRLKERVAVLERVVTENHGSLGLDREIERLRDQRQEG